MARLSDVCNIQAGGTPSRSYVEYWKDGNIPWVKISDIKGKKLYITEEKITELGLEKSSAKLFPKGTILYSIFATLGEVAILDIDATTNQAIAGLQLIDDSVLPDYLYYFLVSKKDFVNNIGRGVAQNNINLKILRDMAITIPSKKEQKDIILRLNTINQSIEWRKQQLSKLDELVKARFIEMFGNVISNSKNWSQYRFGDITTSRLGKMLDSKQQTGKCSFPYLANFNVQWFRFELDKLNVMDFDEKDQKEFELIDGDLLVCEGGEIGRCAVWHNEMQPCFFQKALHRVRCNKDIVLPDYMAYWFKYNCDHNGFSDIAGAKATIAHLPGAKLKKLIVTVPPLGLQHEFATFVEQIDKSKFEVQQSLEKLETLKKSLMQQYFG